MLAPVASPHDLNLMFIACDMSGSYRSMDGGRSWRMLDKCHPRDAISCPPLFRPRDPNIVYTCSSTAKAPQPGYWLRGFLW